MQVPCTLVHQNDRHVMVFWFKTEPKCFRPMQSFHRIVGCVKKATSIGIRVSLHCIAKVKSVFAKMVELLELACKVLHWLACVKFIKE